MRVRKLHTGYRRSGFEEFYNLVVPHHARYA